MTLARISNWLLALALIAATLLAPGGVALGAPASAGSLEPAAPQGPTAAGETCVVFQPGPSSGKDAYIKQEKQDERRGGDSELRVKNESNKLKRALLQFDLSSIPASAIVTNATLSLYVKGASGGALTINAHRVTASWTELEVTWKARDKAASLLWTNLGGDYDAAVAGMASVDDTKDVWRSWTITSLADGWVDNPASNLGVILEAAGSPNKEKVFKSSDDGTASQRPKLAVCYTSGVTISPNNSGEGVGGQTRTYAHVVHVGNLTTQVNLSAVSNRGWTTRIYEDENGNGLKDPQDDLISQTPVIGPNADYPILVQIDIPAGSPLGTQDVTTVTATAQVNGNSATATDTTRVGQLLIVQPDYSRFATAGTVLFYGHTVINNGGVQDCVTVAADSSQNWTVLLWQDLNKNGVHETNNPNEPALSNPVCLAPGEVYYLVAEVQVPGGASANTVDQTLITATSGNEPSKSDTATDSTTVFVNTPPVIDGKYDEIYNISPDATTVCYNNPEGVLFGKLATFYQPAGNAVYMVLAIDKDFVDNTYGANAINWPSGHTFGNLTGSDHAQFYGYDANDTEVLDFRLDYLTSTTVTAQRPSGYASLGVAGGEGDITPNNPALVPEWGTSLDYSLNQLGYCSGGNCAILGTDLEVDSPATDEFYTPNPTYPNWIFDVIYEAKISMAAFPGGFGSIEVPYIHASPSKLGTNTIYAEPGICPGEIGDRVWYDVNHDGVQDAGEAGINGVQVKLYRDDGDGLLDPTKDAVVGTQTTRSDGNYLFQDLAPNDYFVDVIDATVPGGYVITTHNDPTPRISLAESEIYLEADFGYTQPFADLQIEKTLLSGEPAYVGQEVEFRIRITNSGLTIINFLPLQDWYDTDKFDFLGATPATVDNVDDGILNWSDLTAAQSFGQDLAPGQFFDVTVRFRAAQATGNQLLALDGAASPAGAQAALLFEPLVDGLVDGDYSYIGRIATGDDSSAGSLYRYNGSNMCYWAFVMDRRFNSNVYASSDSAYLLLDGWTAGHDFSKLLNSDQATFRVAYTGGSYSSVGLDLLAGTAGNWSSGQTGKDGSGSPGTAPINDAMTSLHWNLENSNWSDLTHSPPYNYNSTSGNYWEWNLVYEFSIAKSAMNGACGAVTLVDAHNSPSKHNDNLGVIGDLVWNDLDGDGQYDAGEPGLPGVTVNLYQGATLVRTTVTEPGTTGYYLFNNLAAGAYTVNVDESTLPADFVLTTNNEPKTVTIASGGSNLTADFGYWLAGDGSIGDRVFYDLNGDGLPDNDPDPGLDGVTVKLYQGAACTGTPKKTMVTSGNGAYDFTQLVAGTYCVAVDAASVPAGFVLTTNNQPLVVNLGDGQDYNTADFGYQADCDDRTPNLAAVSGAHDDINSPVPNVQDYACVEIDAQLSAIGDFVWYDANRDGIQDVGEPGIPNVTLDLFRDNGDNVCNAGDTKIASTVTDADGGYLFANLPPASYCVDVTDLYGRLTGLAHIVANQSQPDPDGPISLSPGEVYKDADFGYIDEPGPGNAQIGDTVWYDGNTDGIQQPGEPGIPGVTVCATPVGGGAPLCDTTDSNGLYLIEAPEGAYSVAPTNPPAGLTATTPVPHEPVVVLAGDQYLKADFGYFGLQLGQIGNLVFHDKNQNGTYGLSDAPLPGVSVDLIRDSDQDGVWDGGEPIIATITSNGLDGTLGNYLFRGAPAGVYLVHVSDTNSVLIDFVKSPVQPGAAGQDNYNQADPYPVSLAAGGVNLTADFGYYQLDRPNIGVIGNQVWIDPQDQADGLYDLMSADFGQAGVTVELLQGGNVIAETTTGASGDYAFTGLAAGDYQVRVSDDYAVLALYEPTVLGPFPGQDNNNQAQPYAVSLPQAGYNLTADFGYVRTTGNPQDASTIGDLVWQDMNADGTRQPTEPGIGNVSVELLYDANENCVLDAGDFLIGRQFTAGTVVLGANYKFTSDALPPGNYLVRITDVNNALNGYSKSTGPNAGANNNSQVLPYCIPNFNPTGLGDVNTTADFGYWRPVAVGDFAWVDGNSNGVYDPGQEPPLNDVLIRVTNSAGQTVGLAVTGPAGGFAGPGQYLVGNLPPDTYTATVLDYPDSVVPAGPMVQVSDPLLSGQSDLTLDFPFNTTTAVEMQSLAAQQRGDAVYLRWSTLFEQDNTGFHVWRGTSASGSFRRLTSEPVPSHSLGGAGASYTWTDGTVSAGVTYWYRLEAIPSGQVFGPVQATSGRWLFMPLAPAR